MGEGNGNGNGKLTGMISEIDAYVRAKYPFIWIRSPEEQEVVASLVQLAKAGKRGVRLWSIVSGFTAVDGSAQSGDQDPQRDMMSVPQMGQGRAFVIFRDYHPFIDPQNPANVMVIRTMREVGKQLRSMPRDDMKTCIFISPSVKLPEELESEVVVLNWPRPDREKLGQVLDDAAGFFELKPDEVDREAVISAALGLTVHEAANCLSRSMIKTKGLDPLLIKDEKKQIIERAGLKWEEPEGDASIIGGLDRLKTWLEVRKKGFSQAALAYGLQPPKGMLILGPPGTGKSLTAKCAGMMWTMPVLSVSADKIKGSFVGESEQKLRKVLDTAETIAPCVLFFDEIEKLMAGAATSAQTNQGVEANQLGMLLTWMQDNNGVFVAATANSIDTLPPELLRKGRFDELWFVDLPNVVEREAIFRVHLSKRGREPDKFEVAQLAKETEQFSGAEIEAAVVTAMFAGFSEDREFETKDVKLACMNTVPLAKTKGEELEDFRRKARIRCALASTELEEEVEDGRFGSLDVM